ncbi:MAG: TonB-dependent receptor [Prevotella sp.]|nr:TonB-dependent receptor [Prevotella sp.]
MSALRSNFAPVKLLFVLTAWLTVVPLVAQEADSSRVSTLDDQSLQEVTITAHKLGRMKAAGIGNADLISSKELLRAACCNLGESFTTNPSVDVNYADAATGAQQIKLLGLSGTYVQMMTENIPNYRGVAAPYALGYIPGPWMQSIQVSKGASSVKNGFESITGQINVEFKKPQATPFADANIYVNSDQKVEANLGANLRLGDRWSTALLGHYELQDKAHDDNDDGFADMPKMRQGTLMSRWAYMSDAYIFQAAIKGLKEHREGGQNVHAHSAHAADMQQPAYLTDITNERYEAFTKNAFIINQEHMTNVALILSGSIHHLRSLYGAKDYDADQHNGYASLLFETDFDSHHSLSAGLSLDYDRLNSSLSIPTTVASALTAETAATSRSTETTPGAYAQYTYKLGERLTLMGGLRIDHSSQWGSFLTPRMHVMYAPTEVVTLRGSVGKGYRTPHVLAENSYLLASGRQLAIGDIKQEEAWNYGLSAAFTIPLGERTLQLGAEYYYTHFLQQAIIDYDQPPYQDARYPSPVTRVLSIHPMADGDKSFSHTIQMDATCEVLPQLTVTAAWRWNDVRSTYNGQLRQKPLNSRYKGLLSASYAPGLGKWQLDATLQLNGGGRLPDNYGTGAWDEHFGAYEQLSMQLTRFFRNWSIYAGGENITRFKQKNAIVAANNPWSRDFDATMIWGPVHGAVWYVGVRLNWEKL